MILMGKDDTETYNTPNNFAFSGIDVENLDGSEYTAVSILVDLSYSVESFKSELEQALNTIIQSCKKAPTSENLLVRVGGFTSSTPGHVEEFHGFIPLSDISDDRYTGALNPRGATPLYDAAGSSIEGIEAYGKQLFDQEYQCNGIFFILTDGEENRSTTIKDPVKIKETLQRVRRDEMLESVRAILVGVNDTQCASALQSFKDDAGFDEFISLGDATPGKLAKLANWVSQSISSQSQSLGNGGPSQPVDFTL